MGEDLWEVFGLSNDEFGFKFIGTTRAATAYEALELVLPTLTGHKMWRHQLDGAAYILRSTSAGPYLAVRHST